MLMLLRGQRSLRLEQAMGPTSEPFPVPLAPSQKLPQHAVEGPALWVPPAPVLQQVDWISLGEPRLQR
jgi:hypothetical protein